MKKIYKTFISLACIILLSLPVLISCKKPQMGPAGSDGANGTNGVNGNANVISTNTINVSSWTSNGASWSATLTVPEITQEIVNKGMVQVFVKYGNQWWNLPDMTNKNSTQYGFELGSVYILNSNNDGSNPVNPGPKIFRVVVASSLN